MSRITEHRNAHLSTDNMHEVKGFPSATVGSSSVKSIDGQSEWLRAKVLPNALSTTTGYTSPPTEVEGDIYVIESPSLNIDGIVWLSGTSVTFTFSGGYSDIYAVNNYLQVSGALDAKHNGVFLITAKTASTLVVTISTVTDGTEDDSSGSPALAYVTHEDYDPENLANGNSIPRVGQVRFYGTPDLWYGNDFIKSDKWFNEAISTYEYFSGTTIVTEGSYENNVTKTTTYTATSTEKIIYVASSGGIFTVSLEVLPINNRVIRVVDAEGSCGTNTVTISGNGNNINGGASTTIATNYGTLNLLYNGTFWNII